MFSFVRQLFGERNQKLNNTFTTQANWVCDDEHMLRHTYILLDLKYTIMRSLLIRTVFERHYTNFADLY
jgi:hypothetical protein